MRPTQKHFEPSKKIDQSFVILNWLIFPKLSHLEAILKIKQFSS